MSKFEKYIPFCKVDEAKREVYGIVTAEVEDKVGEICHYESTKAEYKAWSAEFQKATEGKSFGNLREMHQLKAAGRGIALDFNDANKEILMGFYVSDDGAWQKVLDCVYTGFSQGGNAKVWTEGKKKYFTAKPSEVSLVDNPCLGVCHFAFVRADGAVEMRKIRTEDEPTPDTSATKAEPAAGFTLPPITIEQALRAARGEDPQLTAEQIAGFATLKALIEKTPAVPATQAPKTLPVAKTFTAEIEKAMATLPQALEQVQKGMYDVAQFACLLEDLNWLKLMAEWEAAYEEDESPVPAALLAQLKQLCQVFLAMAEEEIGELTATTEKATYAQLRKASALLPKAAEKLTTKQAGPPAEEGVTTMSDLHKSKAGLIDSLKAFLGELEAEGKETQKAAEPPAAVVPAVAAPAAVAEPTAKAAAPAAQEPVAKGMNDQFETVLKGMQDQFKEFMEGLAGTLAPPKASANGVVKAVTKTQDVAPAAPAAATEPEHEIAFRPQVSKTADLAISDEYRAAMRKSISGGVSLGPVE